MSAGMLDSIKSALNRMRPRHRRHVPPTQPESPRDTFAHAKPRAPYDPSEPHRTEETRPEGGAGRGGHAVGVPPGAQHKARKVAGSRSGAFTSEKLAASHDLLRAMHVDAFIGQMVACASCPGMLLREPVLQQVQWTAMQSYVDPHWLSPWLTPLMLEAAHDLCDEFSDTTLRALATFAKTEAGFALFAVVPLLRLQLKYGESLGEPCDTRLHEDDQQVLLACLRQISPGILDALERLPPEAMQLAWTCPFTPEVIQDIAAFMRRAEGRAFVDYAQRCCWLGIPNAIVLQRDAWIAGVQSDMISILQGEGIAVPPPCDAMPVYVPSDVTIGALPYNM